MTTCGECLTALSTMRLSEIRRGSPIEQHYATCENCSRVAADLQYAERKLALALSELGCNRRSRKTAAKKCCEMVSERALCVWCVDSRDLRDGETHYP